MHLDWLTRLQWCNEGDLLGGLLLAKSRSSLKPLQANGWMWGVEYIYKPIHSPWTIRRSHD
jgi:hypothetical protein